MEAIREKKERERKRTDTERDTHTHLVRKTGIKILFLEIFMGLVYIYILSIVCTVSQCILSVQMGRGDNGTDKRTRAVKLLKNAAGPEVIMIESALSWWLSLTLSLATPLLVSHTTAENRTKLSLSMKRR